MVGFEKRPPKGAQACQLEVSTPTALPQPGWAVCLLVGVIDLIMGKCWFQLGALWLWALSGTLCSGN